MARPNNIAEYLKRVDADEQTALYFMAWEYFRGEFVARNVNTAIALLRRMEKTFPEDARFNIAKMKYADGDDSFVNDIQNDCKAGFGPSLYLMGTYSLKRIGGEEGRKKAIQYYSAAADRGHLPSKFVAWRLSDMSIGTRLVTAVPALKAFLKAAMINGRNDRDIRAMI